MKIVHKLSLLVIFASAMAWIVGYAISVQSEAVLHQELALKSRMRAQAVMREISNSLHNRVVEWQVLRHDPSLNELLIESNRQFESLKNRNERISALDSQWRSLGNKLMLVKEIESHPVSNKFRTWIGEFEKEFGYSLYPEVFLTNRFGVNVAQSGTTSDYLQSDEKWWVDAVANGVYVGNVEFDESAKHYVLPVGIRVLDDAGELAGVIKTLINIQEISGIVAASDHDEFEGTVLLDHNNQVIVDSRKDSIPLNSSFNSAHFEGKISKQNSWSVEYTDPSSDAKFLRSYASVLQGDLLEQSSWKVLIEQPYDKVFLLQRTLHTRFMYMQILGSILCLIVGILLAYSITRRLSRIIGAVSDVTDEQKRISLKVSGSDEIAQLARVLVKMSERVETANSEIKKLAQIAEKSDNAVILTDPEGYIEWVNAGFTRITEYSADEVLGKKPGSVLQGPDTDPATVDYMSSCIKNKKSFSTQVLNYTKSGKPYWLDLRVQPLEDDNGQVQHFMAIESDLTELKEKEYRLEQALKDQEHALKIAEEATRAKSDFLASMSHELRTPMNSILGFTQRLIKKIGDSLSERDLDALTTVDRNAKHLLTLINDILDLSKIEAGKMTLDATCFDIAVVANGVISAVTPLAESKGLKLSSSIQDSVTVLADRTKITQIFTNLLSNAIKYTDSGSVQFTLAADKTRPDVIITVKDTGIGIREEDQDKLFTKFTQLDREERRRKGGTGLGLAITKEYLEMHHGSIKVASVWEQGSSFSVVLPVKASNRHQPSLNSESDLPQGDQETSINILCVDDDPDILKFLKLTFEDEGYKVVLANSHDQAIEAVKNGKPDLICLDICMPEKSGYDVLDSLSEIGGTREIPIVMVSAVSDLRVSSARRVTRYLSKPVEGEKLLTEVRTALAEDIESVLVVEDCDDTAVLLVETLSDCGIEVVRVSNGLEALDALEKRDYSAIILDLMMPEMDGVSFLREFNDLPVSENTPVFILTAKKLDMEEIDVLGKSSEAILTKGKDNTTKLLDTILRHFRHAQLESDKCQPH